MARVKKTLSKTSTKMLNDFLKYAGGWIIDPKLEKKMDAVKKDLKRFGYVTKEKD